jgi:hypothetical protein
MNDLEILSKVKTAMGISGDYQDDLLEIYMTSVMDFMKNAGVSDSAIRDKKSIAVITRGVIDLWGYSSGKGKFSSLFEEMVEQLRRTRGKEGGTDESTVQ